MSEEQNNLMPDDYWSQFSPEGGNLFVSVYEVICCYFNKSIHPI